MTEVGGWSNELDPGLLGRYSWDVEGTRRDVETLAWIGRFRFVTAQAISERFGVSWQRANARVRRLERLGLVGCAREHVSQPRAVFLTGRGHEMLGWPRRRAPRAQTQRAHEEAIVALVTALERRARAAVVLTERECRQREAIDPTDRLSVDVQGEGRDRRRWPDVVIDAGSGRVAVEIELAPKGTPRLRRIVDGYEASRYDRVVFLVRQGALAQRIASLAGRPRPLREQLGLPTTAVEVRVWPNGGHALSDALADAHLP